MPKYEYTALNLQNKRMKGTLDARGDAELRKLLRTQELVLLKAKPLEDTQTRYRLKSAEVSEFSRQLSSMLQSGITVVRALEIIKDRDMKPPIGSIYQRMHKEVQMGCTLSEAMRTQGRAFPELLVNMYMSGEASGQLERAADKMATHYDKENRLNGKVKTAMTYPAILAVVTLVVIMLLFTIILPQFFTVFADMGTELPPVTKLLVGVSHFLQNQWYMALLFLAAVVVFVRLMLRNDGIALKVDRMKLRLPIAGKLLKVIYTARFARTLSSLYSSGLSMLQALEIAGTIIGNKYIAHQFASSITNVRNGDPLSEAIARIDGFDKKVATTILIGEESGRLDAMLESVAEGYDYEADVATSRLVQLIEPIMLVLMALIVGTVMFSVIMPLLSLYQNIG